jgi:AraC-like DNA-binding protein
MIAIETLIQIDVRNLNRGEGKPSASKIDRRIENSITYMAQHLNRPLNVTELAAEAGVTTSYFFYAFKRRTGCTPKDYFTRLRMQLACQLLENNRLNVKEVAGQLGYDDPLYFSRVFKSVNGIAPTNYRVVRWEMVDKTIETRGGIRFAPQNMNLINA